MADTTVNNNTKSTPDDNFIICPCCGKPTLAKPLQPNTMLLDHWLACMVSGVPFSHTYSVYENKLSITVSQLTEEMLGAVKTIKTAITYAQEKLPDTWLFKEELDKVVNAAEANIGILDITLTSNQASKVFKPSENIFTIATDMNKLTLNMPDKLEEYEVALEKLSKKLMSTEVLSGVPLQIKLAVLHTHNSIMDIMMNVGFDQNFWKGIELA